MGLLSLFGASPETQSRVQKGLLDFQMAFPELRRQKMEEDQAASDAEWKKRQRQMQEEQYAQGQSDRQRSMNDDALIQRLYGMPTEGAMPQGQAGPGMPMPNAGIDPQTFLRQGGTLGGLSKAAEVQKLFAPKEADYKVVGDSLVQIGGAGGGVKEAYRAPVKPPAPPSSVQEFEYGQKNPQFNEWDQGRRKAGATNIGLPKIEVKMGESVAGQIGPMAKDSRIQAQGAVGMFDSADRIQKALDSGKASAGPFTTQVQTVKQLVQKVAGGNDEGIRQTRQVIKGLAQMSVEARKELQGQGQVTESEAAAVAKAESGDINDLTTGELQDLVTLTKRAAHMRAKNHQNIIDSMSGSDATKGMVPFYKIQGMDTLLNYKPQLPQIGGKSAVDAALQKYGVAPK